MGHVSIIRESLVNPLRGRAIFVIYILKSLAHGLRLCFTHAQISLVSQKSESNGSWLCSGIKIIIIRDAFLRSIATSDDDEAEDFGLESLILQQPNMTGMSPLVQYHVKICRTWC